MNLRVSPSILVNKHGVHSVDRVILPDSAYGEYILYENYVAKYHISVFQSNGELNKIGKVIQNSVKSADNTLKRLFADNGKENVTLLKSGFVIPYSKSRIKELHLFSVRKTEDHLMAKAKQTDEP